MAEEQAAPGAQAEAAPKTGKRKLLLIIGAVLLLAAGGGGLFFWKSQQAATTAKAKPVERAPLNFLSLDPPFVVNFEASQIVRFLQLDVRLASRDLPTIELMTRNEPMIRNDLLMLFGNQNYESLASRDGKEKLRAQTLEAVRRIVAAEGGKPELVESVYFTSFVMQ
jgi:flagellar FliL protein